MQVIAGQLLAVEGRFAIIVSRFNDFVTSRLLSGAVDTLQRHGVSESRITVIHVPGAFEIPLVAQHVASSGQYVAVICLGAVIQGQTTHHEYINHQVVAGILQASLTNRIPVTLGVLTCESMEQALDRAGGKAGNKGQEATLAAIEVLSVLQQLSGSTRTEN